VDPQPKNYQVIARKYRPKTFASIVGQEAIVTTLKNGLRLNRLAHAYLFCGCRGTGKTTLARVFAKALNCNNLSQDFDPCNACSSCLDINAGRSLDVLDIDGASNRGIDDIRQINETIGYAPASGKYKIYIIDEVHMLTKEAFNALLKTLEEPPTNVKFFFATTEPHKVLPTIISRCQRFDLNRIPPEILKKKLAWIAQDLNVSCEEDLFSLIANLSEGSLRDAESLFDQMICYAEQPISIEKASAALGLMPQATFLMLDKAFEEQNFCFAFELANDIFASGKDISYFIDHLIEHYRCHLKLKVNRSASFLTAQLKEQYRSSSLIYTEEHCLYILDFLIHWQQQMGKTSWKRISLEMILLHIIRSKHRITLPQLVRRLTELEQKLGQDDLKNRDYGNDVQPPIHPGFIPRLGDKFLSSESAKSCGEIPPVFPEGIAEGIILEGNQGKDHAKIADLEPIKPQTEVMTVASTDVKEDLKFQTSSPVSETKPSLPSAESPSSVQGASQSRYDTLMRFAAVELEGIIKKE
jgi:DNA polymerase-3 subunit gamma/tau